jgi:cleavage and polyadenylation specificity factor subunit 2
MNTRIIIASTHVYTKQMFSFTSLLGAQSSSPASQSLLELEGGIKILVDVGWDESFSPTLLDELEAHVKSLSFILLTHATTAHLAAYAHCCKHFAGFTQVPVYATPPVKSLGRALLQDIYASTPLAASSIPLGKAVEDVPSHFLLQPPSQTEIITFFSSIRTLEYSQPHQPEVSPSSPPPNSLTITAYSAGTSLGGTLWHIQHSVESIVYAVDWNQATDSIFRPAVWLGAGGEAVIKNLSRPSALVCSSRGSQRTILAGGVQSKIEQLIGSIKRTLSQGGTVLIPTDSCAKALEISYYLEQVWKVDRELSQSTGLYFASSAASLTLKYAANMVEWMNPDIANTMDPTEVQQDDQSANRNPFNFKSVKLLEKKRHLDRILTLGEPKVIIASDLSLEWGHARYCFENLCTDSRNLAVLLEESTQKVLDRPSLSSSLWSIFSLQPPGKSQIVNPQGSAVTFSDTSINPLEGEDLLLYQHHLAKERESKLTTDTANTLQEALLDDASSATSSSVDDEEGMQGIALNMTTILNRARAKAGLSDEELGVNILVRKRGIYDWNVRGKRGKDRLFPKRPTRKAPRNDDYGEAIRAEDFMRVDERENEEAETVIDKEPNGVQKARWEESNAEATTIVAEEPQDEEDEEESWHSSGPVKATLLERTCPVFMGITHVDFSRLPDKGSIGMLISLLNPRKLLLIGGNMSETKSLEAECHKLGGSGLEIFAPTMGEVVDASLNTNAWNVKLSIPLQSQLRWQTVGMIGIVSLTAQLRLEDAGITEENTAKRVKNNDAVSTQPDLPPILDLVPMSSTKAITRRALHVGDLRLSDLRKSMLALGFSAEFRAEGTLVINGIVVVRKSDVGKIEVETVIGANGARVGDGTFDAVRKWLYGGLAVIPGW